MSSVAITAGVIITIGVLLTAAMYVAHWYRHWHDDDNEKQRM